MAQTASTTTNIKESILIQLDPGTPGDGLNKVHRHFTELAPSEYYHNRVIEVENHQTQRRYSVRGEEILDVSQRKQLRYLLEDGSVITFDYMEDANAISLTFDVIGATFAEVLEKSSVIRSTLLEVVSGNLQ